MGKLIEEAALPECMQHNFEHLKAHAPQANKGITYVLVKTRLVCFDVA